MIGLDTEPRTRNTRLIANRDVVDSLWIAALATGVSYAASLAFGWTTSVDVLEAFAVFTSYSCAYLCVKQRRFNYPIGALSTAAYCLLFWREGLYASMALNAYLTPALLYGWIRWRADAVSRPVTRVARKWLPAYLGATAIGFGGAFLVTDALGGSFAATDSIILVGTMLAQFLLDNKKIETWAVWFVVDVVGIGVYASSGLPLASLQFAFFLGNAVWGWAAWRRAMQVDPRGDNR